MSELGDRLIEAVRRKAGQLPYWKYRAPQHYVGQGINIPDTTCQYVHPDGKPGCLLGHALCEAGLIDVSLRDDPDGLNSKIFSELAQMLEFPLDADELEWLSQVQNWQDAGQTWGYCVEHADIKYLQPA